LIHCLWQSLTQVVRLVEEPEVFVVVHFAFLARHEAAHATPFPGAKQLAKLVSYSA